MILFNDCGSREFFFVPIYTAGEGVIGVTAMFLRLVKEIAEKENVTEQLKSTDQILWVQKMNNVRNRVTEIVNEELIYTV